MPHHESLKILRLRSRCLEKLRAWPQAQPSTQSPGSQGLRESAGRSANAVWMPEQLFLCSCPAGPPASRLSSFHSRGCVPRPPSVETGSSRPREALLSRRATVLSLQVSKGTHGTQDASPHCKVASYISIGRSCGHLRFPPSL